MEKTFKRAKTPQEKHEILYRLLQVWNQNPELRLCQLICNISERYDFFYIEDYDFVNDLEEFYKKDEQ